MDKYPNFKHDSKKSRNPVWHVFDSNTHYPNFQKNIYRDIYLLVSEENWSIVSLNSLEKRESDGNFCPEHFLFIN